jgi:thiopeptide-type bacteriocin biosynthesis protein
VDELGWIGGHAHDIVVPLLTTRPPVPSPLTRHRPEVTNSTHGHIPGGVEANWLNAKIFSHPERIDDLIAEYLVHLEASLDDKAARVWFVRFRGRHETDHLRLRLDTPTAELFAHRAAAVGAWAEQLRRRGAASRVVFDTYYPETGRYGHGAAMAAAETVFVADSRVVATQLRQLPAAVIDPRALTALNMIHTVAGLLGGTAEAMRWFLTRSRASTAPAADRAALQQAARLHRGLTPAGLPEFTGPPAAAWAERHQALAHYRGTLHPGVDLDAVLEALLHMHHNRARGIDRPDEAECRRVARHTALGWVARHSGGTP